MDKEEKGPRSNLLLRRKELLIRAGWDTVSGREIITKICVGLYPWFLTIRSSIP